MKLMREFPQGGFARDGKSFYINTPEPPRPWTNHLWNENFLAVFAQNGQGFSLRQEGSGGRIHFVKDRMIYLEEEGEILPVFGVSPEAGREYYECVHYQGYSRIVSRIRGLEVTLTCFVPLQGTYELWRVGVVNLSDRPRAFRIIAAVDTALGERQDITSAYGTRDEETGVLTGHNVIRYGAWFHHHTKGEEEKGFFAASRMPDGWECRRSAVWGPYGSRDNPRRLRENPGLKNNPSEFENLLFADEFNLDLPTEGGDTLFFAAGVWDSPEEIRMAREHLSQDAFHKVLEARIEEVQTANGGAVIETGEPVFDLFCNHWLKHQTRFNAAWARIYYNGFRDLCQDNGNMAFIDPAGGKAKLCETLRHQYPHGHAPRGWCEGQLIEQDYADSAVWIINAVHNYIIEEGSCELLLLRLPFTDGEIGTVLEHCRRAMGYLWEDRGPHGLSLIHGGDWNDMLNGAGTEGRGESLWLSMAFAQALELYAELCALAGEETEGETILERRRILLDNIEKHGWDGAWYRRAFTDSGRPLGSSEEDEGQCYLNTQAWAAISGAGISGDEAGRAQTALKSAEELLGSEKGLATLFPPYRSFDPEAGYISSVRPGTNTNGGIYIHSNAFKILADCILKRPESAWNALRRILPFSEVREPVSGPPYTLPNSYLGPESSYRYGDYGGAWITGTAGWIHTVVMNYMFGVRPVWEGLLIDPCLPPEWTRAHMTRLFRGADYDLLFLQEGGSTEGLWEIRVNDELLEGAILPCEKGKKYKAVITKIKKEGE